MTDEDVTAAGWLDGYLASSLVYAFDRMGLWDLLVAGPAPGAAELAARLSTDRARLEAMVATAARLGMLAVAHDGAISLTPRGEAMVVHRSRYVLTLGGYGALFAGLADLATGAKRYGREIRRDDAEVSRGCALVQLPGVARVLDEILDSVRFDRVADIGCADASRLVYLCRRYPHVTGVGIDISSEACELAVSKVRAAGLADRIEVIQADIEAVIADPARHAGRLGNIDLVANSYMLHHLIDDAARRVPVIEGLKRAFPSARCFLIADHFRASADEAGRPPIFSLEYDLFHALMGVTIQPCEAYEELFRATGLTVLQRRSLGHPDEWVYLLRPEEAPA